MKKRSIWNKYGKKTAEYVNEWGKWYRFDTYADFGINIVVLPFMGEKRFVVSGL